MLFPWKQLKSPRLEKSAQGFIQLQLKCCFYFANSVLQPDYKTAPEQLLTAAKATPPQPGLSCSFLFFCKQLSDAHVSRSEGSQVYPYRKPLSLPPSCSDVDFDRAHFLQELPLSKAAFTKGAQASSELLIYIRGTGHCIVWMWWFQDVSLMRREKKQSEPKHRPFFYNITGLIFKHSSEWWTYFWQVYLSVTGYCQLAFTVLDTFSGLFPGLVSS